MTSNITGRVIDFVESVAFDRLPGESVTKIKQLLLDSIGCSFAGQLVDRGKMALEYAHETAAAHQASTSRS